MTNAKRTMFGYAAGLGIALAVMAFGLPANARIVTGYGSFTPFPNPAAQDCVSEGFGRAVSSCSAPQTLLFELSDDNGGPSTVKLVTAGTTGAAFTCDARALSPDGSVFRQSSEATAHSGIVETLSMGVTGNEDWSLEVVCSNVPAGRGVASISYNP